VHNQFALKTAKQRLEEAQREYETERALAAEKGITESEDGADAAETEDSASDDNSDESSDETSDSGEDAEESPEDLVGRVVARRNTRRSNEPKE